MKKNFLNRLFVLASLFCVLGVTKGLAFENHRNSNSKIIATENSQKNTEITNKLNQLVAFCKNTPGPICDEAMILNQQAANLAWSVCIDSPNLCVEIQEWALNFFDRVNKICEAESASEYPEYYTAKLRAIEPLKSFITNMQTSK
ncbi:MAG: hypothetical protein ACK5NT_16105 [Pyrinomonadaceae bacterium]